MSRRLLTIILLLTVLYSLSASAQPPTAVKPDSSELITPVNAQPLSIETMARRRGLVVDTPAKNLIIFCTSGFTGASAAFRDAYISTRRDAIRWQGFQLIYPAWADRHKGAKNNIILALSQFGKRLILASDHNFALPGLVTGKDSPEQADIGPFSMAISLSDNADAAGRAILTGDSASEPETATDLRGLEKLFAGNSQKLIACLNLAETARPGFAEIVSAMISRAALAPDGFCAIINLSAVGRHRSNNHFTRMLESMKLRETLLNQLETFTTSRKDTLLIVLDEPENGQWQAGEQFSAAEFVKTLKELPTLFGKLTLKETNIAAELKGLGSEFSFAVNEIVGAFNQGNHDKARHLIEEAVNRRFTISFSSSQKEGSCAGHTILAQGQNADLFFGISSFPEFFRRLSLAIGIETGSKP